MLAAIASSPAWGGRRCGRLRRRVRLPRQTGGVIGGKGKNLEVKKSFYGEDFLIRDARGLVARLGRGGTNERSELAAGRTEGAGSLASILGDFEFIKSRIVSQQRLQAAKSDRLLAANVYA